MSHPGNTVKNLECCLHVGNDVFDIEVGVYTQATSRFGFGYNIIQALYPIYLKVFLKKYFVKTFGYYIVLSTNF